MRPVDDDLVGLGEALGGREDGARVDHGDLESQKLPHANESGGEVDRAEHDHPGLRREGLHEDVEAFTEALALGAVVQEARRARLEHADGVLAHGVIEPARSERALRARLAHDKVPADEVRPGHDRRDGYRLLVGDALRDAGELRPRLVVDPLDENLEDAAAGQADREGVVVADAICLEA